MRSSLSGFSGDELQALREELDTISQAFRVEDQVQLEGWHAISKVFMYLVVVHLLCNSNTISNRLPVIMYALYAVLDDDSSKLSEVLELFSNVTLPLKVEKLIKVSEEYPHDTYMCMYR